MVVGRLSWIASGLISRVLQFHDDGNLFTTMPGIAASEGELSPALPVSLERSNAPARSEIAVLGGDRSCRK
jgi:hypothetical protein